MDKKGWVVCPKVSIDIDVYVPVARCSTCGGCPEASKAAMGQLMTIPHDAETMQARKEHLHGRCPRTKGWCNASRAYCIYNMVCSDEHARTTLRFVIREEKMFIIKGTNGAMTVADKKAKTIKDVPFNGDVHAVYEVKRSLMLMKTLLPVQKETEVGGINLKAPDLKNARIILAKDGKPVREVSSQEFLDEIRKDTSLSGIIIDKTYQPSYELKVVPMATPKPAAAKTVKKAGGKDAGKEA